MTRRNGPRLPISALGSLYVRLGGGALSGQLFADVCDQLLLAEVDSFGAEVRSPSDRAGDVRGLDAMVESHQQPFKGMSGLIGFHYKFFPSETVDLAPAQRTRIKEALQRGNVKGPEAEKIEKRYGKLAHLVLITPEDFNKHQEEWFEGLRDLFPFALHHWGQKELARLLTRHLAIALDFYPDLASSAAVDLERHCRSVIGRVRRAGVHDSWYQPLLISDGRVADEVLDEFSASPAKRMLCVLASFGNGKTTTLEKLALRLAEQYLAAGAGPLPVFIPMHALKDTGSLQHSIIELLKVEYGMEVSIAALRQLASESGLVFIVDGFDEMSRASAMERASIAQLMSLLGVNAKLVVSSRTEFFRNSWEEIQEVFGAHRSWAIRLDERRDLGAADDQTGIVYLQGFTHQMVVHYVTSRAPDYAERLLRSVERKYNLEELSRRPVLLDMICDAGPSLIESLDVITSAELYEGYAREHLRRDISKGRVAGDVDDFLAVISLLALLISDRMPRRIHFDEIRKTLSVESADKLRGLLSTSFLSRDALGVFEFAHQSFIEFFAGRAFALRALNGTCDSEVNLRLAHASAETIAFMRGCLRCGVGDMGRADRNREKPSLAASLPVTCDQFTEFLTKSGRSCATLLEIEGFAAVTWSDAMAFASWAGGRLPNLEELIAHAGILWDESGWPLRGARQSVFSALPVGESQRLMGRDGFLICRDCWEWSITGEPTDWRWSLMHSGRRSISSYAVHPYLANKSAGCFRVV